MAPPVPLRIALMLLLGSCSLLVGGAVPCSFKWKTRTNYNITVPVGTTCSWVWADIQSHCVKAKGHNPDPKFGSGNFVPPYTYKFKFTKPGTYNYICCIHAALMKGTVIVKGGGGGGTCTPACQGRCWGGNGCKGVCPWPTKRTAANCQACCSAKRTNKANVPACVKQCQKA